MPIPGLSSVISELWWSRPDLQEAYPGVFLDPAAREDFRKWLHTFGETEGLASTQLPDISNPLDAQLLDTQLLDGHALNQAPTVEQGVTCVGYHRAVLGVGAAGRQLATLFEIAGERVHRRSYDHTLAPLTVPFHESDDHGRTAPKLDVLAIAVNGSETARAMRALGATVTEHCYRIGFWAWELEEVPVEQRAGFAHVDEVWCNSTFVRDALRRVAPSHIPVHTVPFGIPSPDRIAPTPTPDERTRIGLPQSGPLVGFSFDYASSLDRKNPCALIDAYCEAVPSEREISDRPSLVIKTLNAHLHEDEAQQLRAHIASTERSDIHVINRTYSSDERDVFLRSLAAYVSLHRSEGFGLGLLEAMTLGIPVIATAYSGNLDFMNGTNSWLIPYRLVPSPNRGLYATTHAAAEQSLWAEADRSAASRAIQTVLADTAEVRARAKQASKDATRRNDPTVGARWIKQRLAEIRSTDKTGRRSS